MKYKKQLLTLAAIVVIIAVVVLTQSKDNYNGYSESYANDGDMMAMAPQAAMMKSESFGLSDVASGVSGRMTNDIVLPPVEEGGVVAPDVTDRLIIRNGSLSLVVDDVRAAATALQRMAEAAGGFVISSNVNEYNNNAPTAHVTLRIPSEGLDNAVLAVRSLGTVESEHISGQDVTEEFVDIEAQLENLLVTEAQFQEIMKRAGEISDVLAVQRELTRVRGQIERLEGRKKYLTESAAFSMLTISMSTDPAELPVVDGDDWRPGVIARDAVRSLVVLGQSLVSFGIWLLVYAPVWIIGLLILWVVRRRMIQ